MVEPAAQSADSSKEINKGKCWIFVDDLGACVQKSMQDGDRSLSGFLPPAFPTIQRGEAEAHNGSQLFEANSDLLAQP
ncbi:hypothetical protein D3C80_1725820 [compost metagenome]